MARKFGGYRWYPMPKKDPVIDKLRTIVQDEGFTGKGALQRLSLLSGVSATTYDNMFNGETRLPRHSTIAATINSMGYKEVFVRDRDKKIDREAEIERAIEERRKQRLKQKKNGN